MDLIDAEMMSSLYFIKATTKAETFSFMCFFDDEIDGLRHFQEWAKDSRITAEKLWYADVFSAPDGKHVSSITILPDGAVAMHPAPDDSKLNPFKKRHKNKFMQLVFGQ